MAKQINSKEQKPAWQSCYYCPLQSFKSQVDFVRFVCLHFRFALNEITAFTYGCVYYILSK